MRNGKSILGLKVTGEADGVELGTVKDLIFDHNSDEVVGLLISERELFGLIDAKVIPWNQVRSIGKHAVMVPNEHAIVNAGDEPRIRSIMDRSTALSGTTIRTTEGQDLGTFADMYIDETTGQVVGYEVSGGFFADSMSGKHYMAASPDIRIGRDVALVPAEVAHELESHRQNEPGGLKGAAASVKEKATEAYENIATASIEKQKEFVVGKVASRDVVIPADKAEAAPPAPSTGTSELSSTASLPAAPEYNALPSADNADTISTGVTSSNTVSETSYASSYVQPSELSTTSELSSSSAQSNVSSSGEPVDGEILVRKGETITREHADRAESAGILHQLVIAAGGTSASNAISAGQEKLSGMGAGVQGNAEEAAIGRVAGREVQADNGSTLVAPGQVITQGIMDRARAVGKEREVIAAAGVGTAAAGAATVQEHAVGVWETIKEKAAELTGTAHEKKAEYDAQAEQKRINNALGRPVTRVILDPSDHVILNTGDLITHAAIDSARQAGVLEILLDSVYTTDPEITPEMLRAREPGEAALPTQAVPTGAPITATVASDGDAGSAQTTPSQTQS